MYTIGNFQPEDLQLAHLTYFLAHPVYGVHTAVGYRTTPLGAMRGCVLTENIADNRFKTT